MITFPFLPFVNYFRESQKNIFFQAVVARLQSVSHANICPLIQEIVAQSFNLAFGKQR